MTGHLGGAIHDYERLVKDLLALAAEASIRGEFDEPGSADFAELGSEVYRAIFKATEDVLPAGALEAFAEEWKCGSRSPQPDHESRRGDPRGRRAQGELAP